MADRLAEAAKAAIQSVAMFGSELWWKGEATQGTIGRANDIQLLVNQEPRAVTGCFRTTNLGALAMEPGLRPAAAQLETALGYSGRTETTALLEDPEAFDAETIQEDGDAAKSEAERHQPGLHVHGWVTIGQWSGRIRDRMAERSALGGHQNPHGLQLGSLCAALSRAPETAARRQTTPKRVTIFSDAEAAIRRMVSEDPGPGQMYAIQARKHIAMLRRARPGIIIEIQWCPVLKEC
ncbi:MAG: hypothetical protein QOH03_5512 [Kribbellaceae bacterium]|nr:hypothetical protein [Kribbellaceae bacterium]